MRRILLILLGGAILVGVAWQIAFLPGRVSLHIGTLTIEAAAPVAIALLVLLIGVAYVGLRLLGIVFTLRRRLRRRRLLRTRRLGDAATTRALVALAAGDAGNARREAGRARRLLGDTPQTLLLAAQAARQAGRESEAAMLFGQLTEAGDAAFLGLRGLLQQAMARQDWLAAAALASRAEAAQPGALWLRAERAQLAIRTGAWKDAVILAGPEQPRPAFAAAAAEADADPVEAMRLAKQAWQDEPTLTAAALAYARRLREAGRESRAMKVLHAAWEVRPHPDLATLAYPPPPAGETADPLAKLKAVQSLVAGNPAHPESHLLLARAALEAGLLGEARRHAEAAQHQLDQRRVWLLLAEIAERGGEPAEHVQDALRHAAHAEADPIWRCGACGTPQAGWRPVCAACGTAGRIGWEPPAQRPLAAA
jgi:HemY protein